MNMQLGLVCNLTGERANFEGECKDFKQDETIPQVEEEPLEIWDNSKRAKIVVFVFWALIFIDIVGLYSGYLEIQLLESIQAGAIVTLEEADVSDTRQQIIGIMQLIGYIASAITFLYWFRRAYGNLHRVKVIGLEHEEKWALWSWFVPFISLYRPVQIMSSIWQETQKQISKTDTSYVVQNGGVLIGLWWAVFLLSNLVGKYISKKAFKDETIEELLTSSKVIFASDAIQIPEALLVIIIVTLISKMELKLAESVQLRGGSVLVK